MEEVVTIKLVIISFLNLFLNLNGKLGLSYTKKSKLKAYCRRTTISEDELLLLIHNHSQIGYTHKSKFIEYVPEDRNLTELDRTVMIEKEPDKFSRKVSTIFEERKKYMVHLFESGEKWHCFFFTYKDIEEDNKHWKYGPHLHFVNHLWPEYSKHRVLKSFNNREHNIDGVHIRLEPSPEYEPKEDQEFATLVQHFIAKYKSP